VAVVREPELVLVREETSVLALAQRALRERRSLTELTRGLLSEERLSYDDVYMGQSAWKLLPPIDAPGDPRRVMVSGTGLTHLGSARDRQ